ncbi:MAG TPA: LytTR family DNA-binding domain-containing protein [Vicinamibacterales bacterium]|nr:LytTR family DNA-binding domain-containing protein [Vicinamibacterales bacterium]
MTKFHVLVVDDEPLAREVAASLLRRNPEVGSVAECGDGVRARQMIEETRPDIVFLDIEMPGLGGVELAEQCQSGGPVVVFITAFSRYAVEAFELAATDYVLKPYSDDRFLEALERAKRRVRERRLGELAHQMAGVAAELQHADPSGSTVTDSAPHLQRLSIKQGDRTVVLRPEEIVWIEAQDYCVTIHSTRGNHLVRASLTSLEGRLAPETFVRTHRMAIVNLTHVRETLDRDGLRLVLSEGTQVGVSRSRRSQVESLLAPRLR